MSSMPVVFRMAFRNIVEHKAKSLIVGILLALGSLIIVVGNSFIDASNAGIRSTFTDSYTGDVFVSGLSQDGDVSLFGVMSAGGLSPTPVIPEFERTMQIIRSTPGVSKATGMATGFGFAVRDPEDNIAAGQDQPAGEDDPGSRVLFMFGVDAKDYWDVFDSIDISSGSRLAPGQQGIVVFDEHLASISKALGREYKIGDNILVQGVSSGGMRLRELRIVGTYHQKGKGATPAQMAFVDIDSLRVMSGMTVGANEAVSLSQAQTGLLATDDIQAMFGDDMVESSTGAKGSFDEKALHAALADTVARDQAVSADLGAWQFTVVRTNKPSDAARVIRSLNAAFQREGIQAKAGNWQKAAGPYGQSVDVVRIVFTVAISILAVVAMIIIMNTFVISVIERTGEIGTMRAIGAEKSFIRRLFATETTVLSLVFSMVGALIGLLAVTVIRGLHIEAGNVFFEVLFGGHYLSPFVTVINFAGAVLAMVAVGYIAHLYPVSVALKIQPVRAMQNE